jgi:predicted nucleic acid-binding protein
VIGRVLADTGPLIALIDRREKHHAWVQTQFADISPPLLTCEGVVTEACYLARRTNAGPQAVLELLERGVVVLAFNLHDNLSEVSSFMERYASVPMTLADGCLVRMSELVADCAIFTLDSDFRIYRRHKRQRIPLLMPPDA